MSGIRQKPLTNYDIRKIEIEFQQAVFPILQALVAMKSKSLPRVTVSPDGEVTYKYSKEVEAFEDECFSKINEIRRIILDKYSQPQTAPDAG